MEVREEQAVSALSLSHSLIPPNSAAGSDVGAMSTPGGGSSISANSSGDLRAVAPRYRKPPVKWSKEEDDQLRALVDQHGPKNWKRIAEALPDRTDIGCMQRWKKVLQPGLHKGAWRLPVDEWWRDGRATPGWKQADQDSRLLTAQGVLVHWRPSLPIARPHPES